jgi:hypothetical protein
VITNCSVPSRLVLAAFAAPAQMINTRQQPALPPLHMSVRLGFFYGAVFGDDR